MTRSVTATLAFALASAWPFVSNLAAEEPPTTTVEERLDVELVTVDVVVRNDAGEPVLDLEREDFRVFEDGHPVEIEYFTPPDSIGAVPSEVAGPQAATEIPAHVVVFFDEIHSGAAGRHRLLSQLWTALDEGLGPDDRVMVATYDGSVDIVLPFTDSRRALKNTLRDLVSLSATNLTAGLDHRRAMNTILESQRVDTGGETKGALGTCVPLGGFIKDYAAQAYARVGGAAQGLMAFVESLAGLPGRKSLIHVSDGIPLIAGFEVWNYAVEMCDGSAAREGIDYAVDVSALRDNRYHRFDPFSAQIEIERYNTTEMWIDVAAEANAHQVSFYTLQTSGIRDSSAGVASEIRTTARLANQTRRNDQDTLSLLSHETGGKALLEVNDVRPGLEEMLVDAKSHYGLAYEAPDPGSGHHHRIRVEVDRPGVRVRHRKGYAAKGPHQRIVDGVLSTLYHGIEKNPLAADLEIGRNTDRDLRLRVTIPLGKMVLLPAGEDERGLFSVFVVARDGRGETTDLRESSVPLDVASDEAESATDDVFIYDIGIDLPPETYDLALGIKDEVGGEISYLYRRFRVGGGGSG